MDTLMIAHYPAGAKTGKAKRGSLSGCLALVLDELNTIDDVAENVTDDRAEQGQDGDDDHRHQDEDEGILDKALTLFTRNKQHNDASWKWMKAVHNTTLISIHAKPQGGIGQTGYLTVWQHVTVRCWFPAPSDGRAGSG